MFVEMEEVGVGYKSLQWISPRTGTKVPARSLEDLHYTISFGLPISLSNTHILRSSISRGLFQSEKVVARKGIAPCLHNRLWRNSNSKWGRDA